jgi:hypothetical protein
MFICYHYTPLCAQIQPPRTLDQSISATVFGFAGMVQGCMSIGRVTGKGLWLRSLRSVQSQRVLWLSKRRTPLAFSQFCRIVVGGWCELVSFEPLLDAESCDNMVALIVSQARLSWRMRCCTGRALRSPTTCTPRSLVCEETRLCRVVAGQCYRNASSRCSAVLVLYCEPLVCGARNSEPAEQPPTMGHRRGRGCSYCARPRAPGVSMGGT